MNKPPYISTEVLAGFTLAAVALPQAIAFATALAGVPPEYGIYSAIWGVLITVILNPSSSFLGGPNSTMAAVIGFTLVPLAPQFSDSYVGYMLTLILIAGGLQLVFYFVKPISRLFDLIPESVTNGVITGIGCFLIYKTFAPFAGLPTNTQVYWPLIVSWQTFLSATEIGNMASIQIGMVTLVVGLIVRLYQPLRVWYILIALTCATLFSEILIHKYGNDVLLIEQVGKIAVKFIIPSLPTFDRGSIPDIISMIPGAITLAFIGAFQTVTALRYFDRKTGSYHDVRKGIKTDAFANCVLPFVSSLPTCGSYNRMYLLRSLGAKTKIPIYLSAFVLFLISYFFLDVLKVIPIPALAAVIMLVGINMIQWKNFKVHLNSRVETVAFVTSFMCIHIFGLFGAVVAGSLVSLVHFLWVKSHPLIWSVGNTIYVTDNVYYGSLLQVEKEIIKLKEEEYEEIKIDISKATYFDDESKRFIDLFKEQGGTVIRRRDPHKSAFDRVISNNHRQPQE